MRICADGAMPWNADHDRRALLYRFNPGHAAYTPGVAEFSYPDWVEDMSEEEKVASTRQTLSFLVCAESERVAWRQAVVLQPGFPSSMRVARQPDIGKSKL